MRARVKVWRRGTPLAAARTLFDGETTDVAVQPFIDQDAGTAQPFVVRSVSFFESEYYYAPGLDTPAKLPLPRNADLKGVLDGRAIVTLREPWQYGGRDYPNGAIVAYALRGGAAELVFAPRDTQSVEDVGIGETGLVVQYLDNVSGRAARIVRNGEGRWLLQDIALPAERRRQARLGGRRHGCGVAQLRESDDAADVALRHGVERRRERVRRTGGLRCE